MRPSQVLDRQHDLVSRLDEPQMQKMVEDLMYRQSSQMEGRNDREARVSANWFSTALRATAKASYAYRVVPEMVDLIEFASLGLEAEDTWDRSLAPTGAGFVWFDRPMIVGTWQNGEPLGADALMWGPGPNAGDGLARTFLCWLMDPTRPDAGPGPDAEYVPEVAEVMGRWDLIGWGSVPDGSTMGDPVVTFDPKEEVPAEFSDRWLYAPEQANDKRLVHALWLLLDQTITVLRDEPLERASKRRAVRKGLPPRVTTIALRRAEHRPTEGETHVEWHHTWIVRGHWRWQACGPNRSERKRIWIHPFVKGPEGAPLKQSEKVYDLRR